MSPQLTLSSLFCALALAGLCVATSVRDLSGLTPAAAAIHHEAQAGRTPGLLAG